MSNKAFIESRKEDLKFKDKNEEKLFEAMLIERGKITEPDVWSEYEEVRSDVEEETEWEKLEDEIGYYMNEENGEVILIATSASSINTGLCKIYAQRVYRRLGEPYWLNVVSKGDTHTWLEYDGVCYDADCLEGVLDPQRLPAFSKY